MFLIADNKTGNSFSGFAISVEGNKLEIYSDLDGIFTIIGNDPGNYYH